MCVVAPHRWENSRLGGMSCFFSLSFPSATTEIRCCEIHPHSQQFVFHGILSASGGLFAVAVPPLLLLPVTASTP